MRRVISLAELRRETKKYGFSVMIKKYVEFGIYSLVKDGKLYSHSREFMTSGIPQALLEYLDGIKVIDKGYKYV
jgi:hypothetical protein